MIITFPTFRLVFGWNSLPLHYEIRTKCCCTTPSVSNVLSTTYVYKVWVQTSEQTYQPNILLSSTNLFIGGWWREDFAWWRVRWWRDRSLVASSLVASLLGGEVTGYRAKTKERKVITGAVNMRQAFTNKSHSLYSSSWRIFQQLQRTW